MSYGQYLNVAAWEREWRREFLPMKLLIVFIWLLVALMMGNLCAGWFTMLLLGADRETILTELTGKTYYAYWQTRQISELAAQARIILEGGLLGFGLWLMPWGLFPILSFWPIRKRNEVLVADRDPIPLPGPPYPELSRLVLTAGRILNPNPPTEKGTLIVVGKPSKPDRLADLNILRMMRVANERTERELGPLPPGGMPVVPKQKAKHLRQPWQKQVAVQPDIEVLKNEIALAYEETDEMTWSQMVAAAALTAGALSACARTPRPEPRHNLNPTQRYEITMTIADAPGPFASIDASAYYATVNYNECGVRNESTGIFHDLEDDVPITFTKVSDIQYVATVYADLIQDEDYHGRGVCLWKFNGVGVALKATGAPVEARFVPYIDSDDMLDGRAVTTYFNRVSYPRDPEMDNYGSYGQTNRSRMNLLDSELFTVTLTPKAVTP